MVGSRQAKAHLLKACRDLAEALSRRQIVVTSGLARGADFAAHQGAVRARGAGTLAVLPCGLLKIGPAEARLSQSRTTYVSIVDDEAPFRVSTALARNAVIAALAGGVILVAAGVRGGSWYAVRHAIAAGKPVWCFDAGGLTPEGNRRLILSGQARALDITRSAERLAEEIVARLGKIGAKERKAGRLGQADWVRGSGLS